MIKKIKNIIVSLMSLSLFAMPVLVPAVAHASIKEDLCKGVDAATGDSDCGTATSADNSEVTDIVKKVINILSLVIGAVSVIMIIFGGFKYITSGGESGKVTGAKNTIVYALIGLIVVALAQVIVRFVLTKATA